MKAAVETIISVHDNIPLEEGGGILRSPWSVVLGALLWGSTNASFCLLERVGGSGGLKPRLREDPLLFD